MSAPLNQHESVIHVRLRDIRQLFNSLDATPFPEKDLDADAEEFIVGWAMEMPRSAALRLRVRVAETPEDPKVVEGLESAVRQYFRYRAGVVRRQFRQLMRRGHWSLLIGLTCVVVLVGGAELLRTMMEGPVSRVVIESLVIGGWVAMWRPVQTYLYDWWPLKQQIHVFERLEHARIELLIGPEEHHSGGADR